MVERIRRIRKGYISKKLIELNDFEKKYNLTKDENGVYLKHIGSKELKESIWNITRLVI